jgi:hypothetical protein
MSIKNGQLTFGERVEVSRSPKPSFPADDPTHGITKEHISIVVDGVVYRLDFDLRFSWPEETGKTPINTQRMSREVERAVKPQILAQGGDPSLYGFRGNIHLQVEKLAKERARKNKLARAELAKQQREQQPRVSNDKDLTVCHVAAITLTLDDVPYRLDVKLRLTQPEQEGKTRINTKRVIEDVQATVTPQLLSIGQGSCPTGARGGVLAGIETLLADLTDQIAKQRPRQEQAPGARPATTTDLSDFIKDACLLGEKKRCPAHLLYKEYRSWCLDKKIVFIGAKQFGMALRAKKLKRVRSKSGNVWDGINLISRSIS